jgi:hypothetical protein
MSKRIEREPMKYLSLVLLLGMFNVYAEECASIKLEHQNAKICAEITVDVFSKNYIIKGFWPAISPKNFIDLPIVARKQGAKILCELFLKRKYSRVRSSLIEADGPVLIISSENSGIKIEKDSTVSFGNVYSISTAEKMFYHVECVE